MITPSLNNLYLQCKGFMSLHKFHVAKSRTEIYHNWNDTYFSLGVPTPKPVLALVVLDKEHRRSVVPRSFAKLWALTTLGQYHGCLRGVASSVILAGLNMVHGTLLGNSKKPGGR